MSVEYDKHYQKENYFGTPYSELNIFFDSLSRDLKILDLGSGQGRDAIAIGRLGFSVLGVDISEVGIKQMNEIAKIEQLKVTGIVQDLNQFEDTKEFDIVLIDSILHFYKKDVMNETKLLNRIIQNMKNRALLVIFMQKNKEREKILKNIFKESSFAFQTIIDKYIKYPDFDADYLMLVVRKVYIDKKNNDINRNHKRASSLNKKAKLTCIKDLVNR